MIKIIMHGANGKMGHTISKIVANDPDCEIVAGIDTNTEQFFDYPVYERMDKYEGEADVVIDFSNAVAVESLLEGCIAYNYPVVLCTTGLNEEQLELVKNAGTMIPVLFSANMSLGVNLVSSLVAKAAKVLGNAGFDIEILEKHHNQKLDAPSGTALYIADSINEAMDNKYEYKYDRSQVRAKRAENEIGISAMRGGNIVGEHQIMFAGQDEIVEIKHTAYSKDVFGVGAINAAKFLAGKEAGMYDMGNVIS